MEKPETQRAGRLPGSPPNLETGLTAAQVQTRIAQGLVNADDGIKTKTEKQIILENTFTFFNILNFVLALFVLLVGSFKNLLFLGVIFSNTIIGSFQGIRAKRTIDKLSLISAPKVTVLRDGALQTIAVSEIVLDDVMHLSNGQQICADAIICDGEVEVNESLITGESDPVVKRAGDELLSGSFIVSGSCYAQVEHIGSENYANRIANDAKYIKKAHSEILHSLDFIVKTLGFTLIPIGLLLFSKQFFILHDTLKDAVVSTVAAMLGMIPEGLILLTSVVFAVSVLRLSKYKTLVQDLYCTESLARVDVLCLDKTGTITEGTMQVDELIPLEGFTEQDMTEALTALINVLSDDNPTSNAVKARFTGETSWTATETVAFSSARKWSGASFAAHGTYVMGAGEFILRDHFDTLREQTEAYAARGERVLLLARTDSAFLEGKALPDDLQPVGLIAISDKIRAEAPETLRYFAEQGVTLKVISGDNAVTVSNIAQKAGLAGAENYCDASTLETEADAAAAIEQYTVFGRVTPQQKLQFVKALKENGHTVAMTGDGVNDVLALKEADCSIAMASGSDAARTVSNLVLLDSNFASMPQVVKEGRRSINNLQRSASLFLQKTIYSTVLSVLFIFLSASYPFEPIQLTFISTLTIGIPSFILALEPNRDRVRGSFLTNVLKKSFPSALTMVLGVLFLCLFQQPLGLSSEQVSTLSVIVAFTVGFMLMFKLCVPFNALRGVLFGAMLAAFFLGYIFFMDIFSMVPLSASMLFVLVPLLLVLIVFMMQTNHFMEHIAEKYTKRFLSDRLFKKHRMQNKKTRKEFRRSKQKN
ncbi:cation-translocating P-type ATPase [Anaeromassilibacillus senegalensis]|uniref:Cation-translocating P-type ATPase n=1 Tax=Anaeromassilibacillus senegalensis TaxID=1673717 RepID=A0ABS9CM24_9FIRM|nr:cation-translocating P-type ATPase [Anaeromassilibacillus senegalensis]MCF2652179.1 cation-translocating P-type ATPase [Anaeromassilibacillus senegalensis]